MGPYQATGILFVYILIYFIASTEPLDKYKDIAQAPRTGVHSVRIFGLALVDVMATILLTLVIWVVAWWRFSIRWNPIYIFAALVCISVPVHMFFGVHTALIDFFNPADR